MRVPPPLPVTAQDLGVLRRWVDGEAAGVTAARRARIVLLSGEGLGPTAISDEIGCSKQTVITWRERYRKEGVAGLRDAPRPGRPTTVSASAVVRRTLEPPPAGMRRWTTRLLGADLGVSNASVAGVWRGWGITPGGPGRVRLGTDPVLDGRIATVAGIHLGPSVRVLALRTGEVPGTGPAPDRPGLGDLLARPGDGGDEGVEDFLLGVGATVLVADGATARLEAAGVAVHTVPPNLSWARIVQVACWIAGGNRAGAESVDAMRAALEAGPPGAAISWLPG